MERRACAHLVDWRLQQPATPKPGGVDEAVTLPLVLHDAVEGIARGPRDLRDDRALLPHQAVEQRRLAHVGTTDQGKTDLVPGLLESSEGQRRHGQVQEIADPLAVLCRDRDDVVEAQGSELHPCLVHGLRFVDGHDDGNAAAT
jgi:hypothetical protein